MTVLPLSALRVAKRAEYIISDGYSVLTVSADETAKIWNAATGECKLTLSGHTRRVYSAIFSPDGSSVLTGSGDETAWY